MAKPRSKWTGNIFHRRIDEGRGIGTGKDYKPFIQIHDFPSLGICTRVRSETVGRVHHLFSRNELAFFYILDFDDDVIDIGGFFPDPALCREVMAYEKEQFEKTTFSIGRIANDAESYFHICAGLGLTSFQRLLFEKKLVIPLDKPLDLMAPRLYKGRKGGWHSCLETYQ